MRLKLKRRKETTSTLSTTRKLPKQRSRKVTKDKRLRGSKFNKIRLAQVMTARKEREILRPGRQTTSTGRRIKPRARTTIPKMSSKIPPSPHSPIAAAKAVTATSTTAAKAVTATSTTTTTPKAKFRAT